MFKLIYGLTASKIMTMRMSTTQESAAVAGITGSVIGYFVWGTGVALSCTITLPATAVVGITYYAGRSIDKAAKRADLAASEAARLAREAARETARAAGLWEKNIRYGSEQIGLMAKGTYATGLGIAVALVSNSNLLPMNNFIYKAAVFVTIIGLLAVAKGTVGYTMNRFAASNLPPKPAQLNC